jgi:general secretion pathway protein D
VTRVAADGNQIPGGIAGIAAAEAQKRQKQTEAAQTLFTAGAKAYADKSYAEAMDYFKAAFETVPNVPAVASQRRVFFSRYEAAAYRYALVLADEAKWAECEKTLADVVTLAEVSGIPAGEVDPALRKMLRDLRERDDRYNFSTSPRHLRNVDLVETKLIIAKGYRELGDYDRAERTYHEVLNIDPTSTAARTGLEEVERWRMNYFDAAYDHTRARMLSKVAAEWETPVPPLLSADNVPVSPDGVTAGGSVALDRKLNEIVIPSLEFTDARLADVVDFLGQKAQELDAAEADPAKRGVNIVIDGAGMAPGDNPAERSLSVKLANVPLGVAIKYAAQQVGMTYRTDNFAVRIVSPAAAADSGLANRTWVVPPSFLSGGGGAQAGAAAAPADPFANPAADGGGALVKRISAQQFLTDRGVQFGPGASATFVATTNSLIVRNTTEQLEAVENIVQSARDAGTKLVQIHVKMVSVEETDLNQLGLDWLLGPANFGSTPRAFFAGGTDGNSAVPTAAADYPIVGPGGIPVGTFPVTGGLRNSDFTTGQGIDTVLNRDSPDPSGGRTPAVFAVAGVFTDPQFQMVLRALSQSKSVDLLTDSHVVVIPGQIGKIEQVREFIYPTEYDPPEIPNQFGNVNGGGGGGGGGGLPSQFPVTPATPTAFETRKLGQMIEVEPTVSADNKTVGLNVLLDVSDFSGFINYGTPINDVSTGTAVAITPNEILMPVFDAIKETTNVNVWDGQTVAIGGFHGESITDVEDKIPYLGDLPVLGRAFRSSGTESTRRALTIFVTVRLIDPGGNPINAPVEEEVPELMTRRDPVPASSFAPGPPPVLPAK